MQRILGLFQKRIEGDDALMRLARMRFRETGMGIEVYAGSPGELEYCLSFMPEPGWTAMAHLEREIDPMTDEGADAVIAYARASAGRLRGMVLHDQRESERNAKDYVSAIRGINNRLARIKDAPMLFIEYAAMIAPGAFVDMARALRGLKRVSVCVDIGHMGLKFAKEHFKAMRPGVRISGITPESAEMPVHVETLQRAHRMASESVAAITRELAAIGKPLHFHLHDGHTAVKNTEGLRDHRSFLYTVPLPFAHHGRMSLDPLHGPRGLRRIIEAGLMVEGSTFTLEIHPAEGRTPLGNAAELFAHWTDKTNAEQMNRWLGVLGENCLLVRSIIEGGRAHADI